MKLGIRHLTLFLAIVVLPDVAVHADDGWKMPNLNPFSSGQGTKTGTSSTPGAWWPSSTGSSQTAKKPAQPSTWDKVAHAPKTAWTKTKQTLNPWDTSKSSPARKPVTGTNMMPGFSKPQTPAKKEGFFSGWSKSDDADQKPKTVNDFLAQPRPDY